MAAPFVGVTEERDSSIRSTQQDVFYSMALFLAAIIRALLSIVVGAADRPFRAIVKKRESAGGSDGAVASSSARRSRSATRWRAGRSPRWLKVWWSTGSST